MYSAQKASSVKVERNDSKRDRWEAPFSLIAPSLRVRLERFVSWRAKQCRTCQSILGSVIDQSPLSR